MRKPPNKLVIAGSIFCLLGSVIIAIWIYGIVASLLIIATESAGIGAVSLGLPFIAVMLLMLGFLLLIAGILKKNDPDIYK